MERKESAEKGFLKYNTGRPCRNGHIADRYVKNGACSICVKNNVAGGLAKTLGNLKMIDDNMKEIFLFTQLSGLPALKIAIDSLIISRFPNLSPDAVNPSPYWKKQVSRLTYQIKLKVPLEDVDLAYAIGKLMLEPEIKP